VGAKGWIVGVGASLLLPSASVAAKVLLFLSPFGSGNVCVMNNTFGYNGCSDSAQSGKLTMNSLNWMEFDFATAPTDNLQFAHGASGNNWAWSSGSFNPATLFQSSDTVWAVTDPYPSANNGVAIKILGSRPRSKTVMLWNPWETAGKIPWMRAESGAWGKMSIQTSLPGWYASTVLGYNTLTLLFADSARSQYLGTRGLGDTTRFSVDSIAARSDTIWIRGTPEANPARLVATASQPRAKTLFLFNPWTGQLPVQRPKITIGGAGPYSMYANADYCGWYTYTYFDRTPTVLFTNDRTGATFGKTGIGSTTAFDATGSTDSTWISEPAGVPVLSTAPTSDRGLCEVSYLAATIRDFPSGRPVGDPLFNREFGRGKGCGRSGWGVVQGMADSILGADRKPVRSAHDTGANYPNSWTYAFRCTYDTTEPATKAEIGDTGLGTNWFRTVPGKNAETCRDIPLALDSTTGNYVYDNQHYFPIDDFSRLADGTPNPYYDQISGDDGKLHDFGFCLESHGNFEYKKGQVFRFAGDDDVWFFINNRLAVDLGGIHGTAKDSVYLDSIGSYHDPVLDSTGKATYDRNGRQIFSVKWTAARLVENQTYPFDFFFCERDPQGSDMMIQTSMNLRTDSRFQVRDTLRAAGSHSFDIWISLSQGQGCKAITSLSRSTGQILLWGTALTRRQLSTGTWFGGIVVDSAAGKARVDSSSLQGLAPGTYTLRVQASWDTTSRYDYVFTVPFTAGPRFVTKPAQALIPGRSFPVDVASYDKAGLDSASVAFHLQVPPGLLVYSDSARTRLVSVADTFRTGTGGKPRRLWAVAQTAGSWTLVVGEGTSDTADAWTDIVVLPRSLAFVDSLGRKLSSLPAVSLSPGQGYRMRIGLFAGDTLCTSCSGVLGLSTDNPLLVSSLAQGGASISTATLSAGMASLWVRGATAFDSATLTATLSADTSIHASWWPVSVVGWRLRFLDSTGAVLKAPPATVLDPQEGRKVRVGLFLGDTLCSSCSGTFAIASSNPLLLGSSTQGGPTAGSIVLSAGTGSFWIRGTAPFDSASVALVLSSDTTVRAAWSPVSVLPWRLRFVQGAAASDTLAPIDRIEGDSVTVSVQVWGRSGPCSTCTGLLSLSATGTGIDFHSASGAIATTAPVAAGMATFAVHGAGPAFRDTLHLVSDLGASLAGWPVTFRTAPPDSGRMLDRDGDGRADSLLVFLHRPWHDGSQLRISWPDSVSPRAPARLVPLDSHTLAVVFDPPFGTDATAADGTRGSFSGDGVLWTTFPIRDGVPPVPVQARVSWGDGVSTPDTLRVLLSEPSRLSSTGSAVHLGAGTGTPDQADLRSIALSGDTLVLLWNPASVASCPRPGDSLGLLPAVQDLLGNSPPAFGKKVVVTGSVRPPRRAIYLDSDGDGRIDAVRVELVSPISGDLPEFDISLPGPQGTQVRASQASQRVVGDSLSLLVPLATPFPFGWTSFAPGRWAALSGGPSFPALDGAGPAIDTALIRHTESYDGDDTLLVLPSEPVAGTPSSDWWRVLTGGLESGLSPAPVGRLGDTLVVVLPASSSDGIRPGDSIRWVSAVSDTSGNAASIRWRPVGGAARPAFLRLTPPKPLFLPPSTVGAGSPALEVQVRGGTSWSTGSGSAPVCDTVSCLGPTLELNQAARLVVHVYDLLGVHVASTQADFDPATLPADRLGRIRVRILWNGRTDAGTVAASGVYLIRGLLRTSGTDGAVHIRNEIWKIGLVPMR
jgi:fibro-slime domain-containing protein